jgi:plasmid maintenance system antidote protein VapI
MKGVSMAFLLVECLLPERLAENGNMSQAEFARKMKVKRQFIHSLINMKRIMSYEFSLNASFILNCEMTDFYKTIYVEEQD